LSWLREHAAALFFLGAYSLILAWHAWEGRRGTRAVADYYVGGRALGGVAIGLSFFATYSSTNSFVGFAGQAYTYGAPWLLLAPAVVLFSFLAWVLIAPRLRRFTGELGSLTIPDFIGLRFDSTAARVLSAILVLFASFFYLTAIFKGIGTTLEAFLDVPYLMAVWIVFAIVMTYTAVGGFLSVVKTDVVQGLILVVAALLLLRGTVNAAGGVGAFFDARDVVLPSGRSLFSWNAAMPLPVLLGIVFAGTIKFMVEPRQLSRFYALRDRRAIRHGVWVSTIAFLVVYSALVPIGVFARTIFPTGFEDSDRIVPALLTDPAIFHPALGAFMLVALVAAAMSSIDSVLLVMASTCQRDLVGIVRGARTEAGTIRATAAWVAVFALVTTLIALDPPGGIVRLTSFSGSVYAACFFPALVFGLYLRSGNGTAVIASMTIGLIVLLAWQPLGIAPGVHEVFPALLLSILTYLAIAVLASPARGEHIERLFRAREIDEGRQEVIAIGSRTGSDRD
jgi:SSS family transporter